MKAYVTHGKGIVFSDKDLAVITGDSLDIYCLDKIGIPLIDISVFCDKIYVDGDFNTHDLITIQLGTLSNGLEPEDINCYSHFEVDVTMSNGEDPVCEVKDRNFKLEHLSMELQKRIHDKAEEMYQDWLKVKRD